MTDLTRVEHTGERATDGDLREQAAQSHELEWLRPVVGIVQDQRLTGQVRALPRAGLLRDITDTAVLNHVFSVGRITRAELSTLTGISKPTISDAVRRLAARGVLVESGLQTGRRGRIATYYELAATSGWVLAIELDQDGLNTSSSSLAGEVFAESYRPVPPDATQLIGALRTAVNRDRRAAQNRGPLRVLSVSVSNSVDPSRNDIISLPNSPFPEGLINIRRVMDDLGDTVILLENDVNLAAHAERRVGVARDASSFGYLYLGSGLGFAFHLGDQLIRGARGLAGAIGYLPTGPAPAGTVLQALVSQGFGRPDGTALDVRAVRAVLDLARANDPAAGMRIDMFCRTLVVAVAAVHAVNDPELLVLGGPIGKHPWLLNGCGTRWPNSSRSPRRSPQVRSTARPPCAGRRCARWPTAVSSCSTAPRASGSAGPIAVAATEASVRLARSRSGRARRAEARNRPTRGASGK